VRMLCFVADLLLSLDCVTHFQLYRLSVDVQSGMLAGWATVSFEKTSGTSPRRAEKRRTLGVSRADYDSPRQRHPQRWSVRALQAE
jgi:hypothetical protein